ncbi:MAG: fibronectin type III domain-containing protein, partial [Elusimicrobia bacterium]|nr:fibronectin type III domain-containing protein [Elusimicrobiota bacterium]
SGVGGVAGVALSPSSIQWSWPATPGATSYDVFVATTGQLTGTSTTTVFMDNGLAVDSARSVLVGAVTGGGLGPLSASATIYTLANAPGPVSPQYMSLSTGGFVVNWTNNGNPPAILYALGYTVQKNTGGLKTSTITVNTLFAAVTGLHPSQYAQAAVVALNGNGIPSAPYILNSTYTLANPPASLTITNNTSNAISVGWSTNGNSTTTFYQVTYSTDDFVTNVTTAVTFANGENISTTVISGLLTSTTYWIVVQAENKLGQLSTFSNTVSTITFNGGAPLGLLQGILPAATTGQISGTLGNGQFISLTSQSGSFPTNTLVTISSYDVVATLCPGAVNLGVAINDNPAYMPLRAVLLTLGFTVSGSSPTLSSTVTLMRYVPSSGVCVPLNTTFNSLAQTLTAEINDFGVFVVAAPPAFGSAATARAYPNPYHVNRDGYVTIDQIPPGSRVRVMDLRGDTVLDQTADAAGLVTWSATNGAGRNVSSGLYLVLIEGGGTKKILKLAVIR